VHIWEFLGCIYHGCSCGAEPDETKRLADRTKWELKKEKLQKHGEVHFIWECDWDTYKKKHPEIMGTMTKFPNIMYKNQTEIGLMNAIKEGSFFGFVHCDLW